MAYNRNSSSAGQALDDVIKGSVSRPGTSGYDEERGGFQLLAQHRPEAVVAVKNSEDVVAAVQHAAATGAPLAVQATGHGLNTPLDGSGILISTRQMNAVRVEPERGTAWVEAGARWRDVIDAAAPHGLAPLSGSLPGVGAVSYALGGGVGLMGRRYGFAADHVHRIDIVTADGRLRHVTPDSEPDLFWALRGGGGNFGVVTGIEIGLMPVESLYGGGLVFDLAQVPDLAAAWYRWTADVPEEMTSAVSMMTFPDIPGMPEPMRGRHIGSVQIAFLGSAAEGEELVAPLRALEPMTDGLQEIAYARSEVVFNDPDQPHAYQGDNLLLRDVDPGKLSELFELSSPANPTMCVVGVRHLGGALSRPPEIPNALGLRSAAYSLGVLSPTEPGQVEAVRAMHARALESWSELAVGRLLNFTFGPLSQDEIRTAFTEEDLQRLTRIKAEVDPDALIRSNFPLPAGTGA
jgi:FAD/FMN-containing dehydrogenase